MSCEERGERGRRAEGKGLTRSSSVGKVVLELMPMEDARAKGMKVEERQGATKLCENKDPHAVSAASPRRKMRARSGFLRPVASQPTTPEKKR